MLEDHSESLSGLGLDRLTYISEAVSETVTRDCPFCLCSLEDSHGLRNHIATHLQRIALFALLRSTEFEDASQDDHFSSSKADAVGQASRESGS